MTDTLLSRKEMREYLAEAQADGDLVVCAGCGRRLEREFMEMDHLSPSADRGSDAITNRVLLCGPCNRKKGPKFTLTGLYAANVKDGWMQDEALAKLAAGRARDKAVEVQEQQTGKVVVSDEVQQIKVLTEAEYQELPVKDDNTLYFTY